jgi:dTDP-4-amino-4,6-dideoxygalactose transaminase
MAGKGIRHDLTQTERVSRQALSLPMYPSLGIEKLSAVCEAVNSFR